MGRSQTTARAGASWKGAAWTREGVPGERKPRDYMGDKMTTTRPRRPCDGASVRLMREQSAHELWLRWGVKVYVYPRRCRSCGTMSRIRRSDLVCWPCVMREERYGTARSVSRDVG